MFDRVNGLLAPSNGADSRHEGPEKVKWAAIVYSESVNQRHCTLIFNVKFPIGVSFAKPMPGDLICILHDARLLCLLRPEGNYLDGWVLAVSTA